MFMRVGWREECEFRCPVSGWLPVWEWMEGGDTGVGGGG